MVYSPQISYSAEIWAEIRSRWEHGESGSQIARTPGYPSHVAINKRAKREWERISEPLRSGNNRNALVIPVDMDPRRKAALEAIMIGANYRDAAQAAHVSEDSFLAWRRDPAYAALVKAAETGLKLKMLHRIDRGSERDPKYAAWWLQHHPTSRSEFGNSGGSPQGNTFNLLANINLGIDRTSDPRDESVTIEQLAEPVTIEQPP